MEIINSLESEVRSYCRSFPTVFDTACGARVIDQTGRSYVDFFSGAGALQDVSRYLQRLPGVVLGTEGRWAGSSSTPHSLPGVRRHLKLMWRQRMPSCQESARDPTGLNHGPATTPPDLRNG